ncbi:MAG: hypothetical protein KBD21_02610 [Candidatus Pacebacteria bacterium]|nr:hypothetical protein [Candidatus Paceibacterota bacterium]
MERLAIRVAFFSGALAVFFALVTSLVPHRQNAIVVQSMTDGSIAGDASTTTVSVTEPVLDVAVVPHEAFMKCPFTTSTSDTNAFVVDFTQDGRTSLQDLTLVANSTNTDSERLLRLEMSIPFGTYKVSLAGYDDHSTSTRWYEQDSEQWYMELLDSTGKIIYATPQTRDIGNQESLVVELVASSVPTFGPVLYARAKHGAYPSEYNTQELAPLCALFERTDV